MNPSFVKVQYYVWYRQTWRDANLRDHLTAFALTWAHRHTLASHGKPWQAMANTDVPPLYKQYCPAAMSSDFGCWICLYTKSRWLRLDMSCKVCVTFMAQFVCVWRASMVVQILHQPDFILKCYVTISVFCFSFISRIAEGLEQNLPRLDSIILTNNLMQELVGLCL